VGKAAVFVNGNAVQRFASSELTGCGPPLSPSPPPSLPSAESSKRRNNAELSVAARRCFLSARGGSGPRRRPNLEDDATPSTTKKKNRRDFRCLPRQRTSGLFFFSRQRTHECFYFFSVLGGCIIFKIRAPATHVKPVFFLSTSVDIFFSRTRVASFSRFAVRGIATCSCTIPASAAQFECPPCDPVFLLQCGAASPERASACNCGESPATHSTTTWWCTQNAHRVLRASFSPSSFPSALSRAAKCYLSSAVFGSHLTRSDGCMMKGHGARNSS